MASNENTPLIKPFNPLDKQNLGESVADALLEVSVQPVPPDTFIGAGVYVLYYTGAFPAYAELSEVNRDDQSPYMNSLRGGYCHGVMSLIHTMVTSSGRMPCELPTLPEIVSKRSASSVRLLSVNLRLVAAKISTSLSLRKPPLTEDPYK
jgi:hypothetical protein